MTLADLTALLDVLRANGVTEYEGGVFQASADKPLRLVLRPVPFGMNTARKPDESDDTGGMPTREDLAKLKDEIDKGSHVGPRREP